MELPDVGRHCSKATCKQLDYLPFTCQHCKKTFCQEHSKPRDHECSAAPTGDGARVPTCPICNVPVPVNKGEDPNLAMDRHIASDCRPPPKSTSKPFNSCSFHNCKQRVAVRLLCSGCGRTYCIKHRLEVDHMCEKVRQQNKISHVARLEAQGGKAILTNSAKSKPTLKNWMGNLFKKK